MKNNYVSGPKGLSRRAFLSASAVTALATHPIVRKATPVLAAPVGFTSATSTGNFDPNLRALLTQIDPSRIQATVQKLVSFGTRHTASSQTDPVRGIGAATAWVIGQINAIAATSNGTVIADEEIKMTIVGLFEGETCNYGVEAGTSIGTLTEGSPATFDINAVVKRLAGHSCFFGPETLKMTGRFVITSPNTTMSVSSS